MFEREYIEDLMRRHKMNLSAAAREAQIDRKHLRELIRKYGLDPRQNWRGSRAVSEAAGAAFALVEWVEREVRGSGKAIASGSASRGAPGRARCARGSERREGGLAAERASATPARGD